MKQFIFLALFLISANLNLNAQVVEKIPTQVDSIRPPQVITPIGESRDTVYIEGMYIQKKQPAFFEDFMVITRFYVFQDPKLNKAVEQWAERLPSPLNPNGNPGKKIPTSDIAFWRQVAKPK